MGFILLFGLVLFLSVKHVHFKKRFQWLWKYQENLRITLAVRLLKNIVEWKAYFCQWKILFHKLLELSAKVNVTCKYFAWSGTYSLQFENTKILSPFIKGIFFKVKCGFPALVHFFSVYKPYVEISFIAIMSCKEYVLRIIVFRLFPQSCSCNLKLLYKPYLDGNLRLVCWFTQGLFGELKVGEERWSIK